MEKVQSSGEIRRSREVTEQGGSFKGSCASSNPLFTAGMHCNILQLIGARILHWILL